MDWVLANFLLIKGEHTYWAPVPGQQAYGSFEDIPELYLPIGRPKTDMLQQGDAYYRVFDRVLAIVNPSPNVQIKFALGTDEWRDRNTHVLYSGVIELAPRSAIVLVKP